MDNQNICFPLNSNFTDFSNNKYYFNNINNNDISYGLYETSGNDLSYIYVINNIPKEYPLGFYIDNCYNTGFSDISNLISYQSLNHMIQ